MQRKLDKAIVISAALVMMIILSGCGTASYDTSQSQSLVLPDVVSYSREIQSRAADEAISGQCQAHVEFGKDYARMRDQVRNSQAALAK